MDLPFGIKVNSVDDPSYFKFLTERQLGIKSELTSKYKVIHGEKWYLIMAQVYATAAQYTLDWCLGSYIPDKEDIPMLIKCEQFLELKPHIITTEIAVGMGYKDVILFCLRKNLQKLEDRIRKLIEEHGDRFESSRRIIELLSMNIATVEHL